MYGLSRLNVNMSDELLDLEVHATGLSQQRGQNRTGFVLSFLQITSQGYQNAPLLFCSIYSTDNGKIETLKYAKRATRIYCPTQSKEL